jgi:hypothetical protein
MPDEFEESGSLDNAKKKMETIDLAMTPAARKIGALLSPSEETRANEIVDWDNDELPLSEKADAAREHYWDIAIRLPLPGEKS